MNRKLSLLLIVAAIFLLSVFYFTASQPSPSSEYPAELLEILEANRGNVVVVDVMNTNCPPCIKQVKELRIFMEMKGDNVVLYSISIEYPGFGRDSEETITRFIEENGVTWEIRVSEEPYTFISSLGIVGIPTLLVFDASGDLVYSHAGIVKSGDLLRIVSDAAST